MATDYSYYDYYYYYYYDDYYFFFEVLETYKSDVEQLAPKCVISAFRAGWK